jgi:serine phosphatase RsbU (regulator of sigma subunit)
MKLRTQLILVFFLLAIVPLGGLTLYSYTSSTAAFRQAVEEEASALARGMGARLELVRHDLDRRIRDLGADPFCAIIAENPHQVGSDVYEELVSSLGDLAGMIEAIHFEAMAPPSPRGSSEDRRVPGVPPPPPVRLGDTLMITMPGMPAEGRPPTPEGDGGAPRSMVEVPTGDRFEMWARERTWEGSDRVTDTLEGQEVGEKRREVHLRWMAARLEGRTQDLVQAALAAQEIAQELAVAGTLGSKPDVPGIAVSKKGESRLKYLDLTSKVRIPGDLDGRVVAQVNTDQVLASILSPTRRGRGEVPFAMDQEGRIYTQSPEDLEIIDQLRSRWEGFPSLVHAPDDWMAVVRVEETTGMAFGIARPLRDGLQEIRRAAVRNLGYGMGMVGLALLGILPLSRRMTRNLTVLTLGAERLARGDLDTRVSIHSSDEFGQLGKSFNQMAAELKVHQGRLVERERLRRELEISREIQREMLPRSPLRSPFAEVQGVSIPAREVGGDFFNYFSLPGGRMAILIGDVSGKGVPAALLMANIQASLRARLPVTDDLVSLADQLDREISESTPSEAYLTLFLGILDAEAKVLRWLNAGHNTQYVLRSNGSLEKMASTGRPLGLLPGGRFEERTLRLEEGDAIFLYTDGLVEAENVGTDEFGVLRLERILVEERGSDVNRVLARIEEEVLSYRAGAESNDDTTMVLLRTGQGREDDVGPKKNGRAWGEAYSPLE